MNTFFAEAKSRYPEMFAHTPAYNADMDGYEGWHRHIWDALYVLSQQGGVEILQIKQKLARLEIYASGLQPMGHQAIEDARVKCACTCEACGSPGRRCEIAGYLCIACSSCETQLRKERHDD